MGPDLTRKQRAIFIHVMERCPVHETANFVEFTYPDSGKKTLVATTSFKSDESVQLIFTLGTLCNRVYVTATDGEAQRVADVLAELEEYDSTGSILRIGNTFSSPNDYLQEHERAGAVILSIDTLPSLASLEEDVLIEGEVVSFLLVAFLTESEYVTKAKHGFDALLDLFEHESKDIISIAKRH